MDNYEAIIRHSSDQLQIEIELRERIMETVAFHNGNKFFLTEENKNRMEESYSRSDAAAKILYDAIKQRDEACARGFIAYRGR